MWREFLLVAVCAVVALVLVLLVEGPTIPVRSAVAVWELHSADSSRAQAAVPESGASALSVR